jgi:putative two-component system response regulator
MKTRRTILAIDDIIPCLTMTKQILESQYDVYLAKSVGSAMIILKIARIDLILLDIEMPEMSGLDFFDVLQNAPRYSNIPVIFISSHATKDTFIRAIDAGAKDFLVKPVSPTNLVEKIETAFTRRPEGEINRELLLKGLITLSGIQK